MASDSSTPGRRTPTDRLGSGPLIGVAGLERLRSAVNGLRSGIVELEQSPSFLMLGDARPGTATATEFADAVRQARDFWPLLDALTQRIDEADRLVERHGLTDRDPQSRQVDELNQVLATTLIVELFDGNRSVSMVEALRLLHQRYDAVHRGVTDIDRAWLNVLPRVEAARETVARLRAEADALGVVEPLIGRVRRRAEDLAERLVSDPVSVSDTEGHDLDRLVAEAARHMVDLRTGHDNLGDDVRRTEELLATLRVLRTRAAATAAETRQKIVDPKGLVTVPSRAIIDGSDGLADRLDELLQRTEGDAASGAISWTQQRTLLDQWLTMADRLERQLVDAERRNRRDLDRRDELRGRLQAFSAKMAATGNAESAEAMELAEGAWTELYTAPSDLDVAEAALTQLAEELRKS